MSATIDSTSIVMTQSDCNLLAAILNRGIRRLSGAPCGSRLDIAMDGWLGGERNDGLARCSGILSRQQNEPQVPKSYNWPGALIDSRELRANAQ